MASDLDHLQYFRDWSNVVDRRQRDVDTDHEQLEHERKINEVREQLDCPRWEAVYQLQHGNLEVEI